jgi:hypothetical protein
MSLRTARVAATVPPRRAPAAPRRRWVGWYLVIVGAGVGVLWAASLPGAFDDGLLAYAGTAAAGNIPVFHLVAEAVMAATAIVAGVAILRRFRLGRPAALLANGMMLYSAVNSSGWLLQHQPAVLVLTGATLAGSLASTWVLVADREVNER